MPGPGRPRKKQPEPAPIELPGGELAGMTLPSTYTDEGYAERTAGKPKALSHVIRDEYHGILAAGRNPQEEIAAAFVEANPDKHFRWLTPQHCDMRGTRGYQDVRDPKTDKPVSYLNPDRKLGWIPKDEHKRREADNLNRANRARMNAQETLLEQGERAERDTGGAIRMVKPGSVIDGIPLPDNRPVRGGRPIGS